MEILYLYFKKDDSILFSGQNINFGGQYRFFYNEDNKELEITENPFYDKDFFQVYGKEEDANILNVTSIIGQNGTGKSALLNLIKIYFSSGNAGIKHPLIISLKVADKLIVYHFTELEIKNSNKHGVLEIKELANKRYNKILNEKSQYQIATIPTIKDFEDVDFIHFSNIFNGNDEVEYYGAFELSTDFLVRQDYIKNSEMNLLNPSSNQQQIDIHVFSEIERQIAFINKYSGEYFIPFDLPEFVLVYPKRDIEYDSGFSDAEKRAVEEYGFKEEIRQVLKILESLSQVEGKKERLLVSFVSICIINFLVELAINYRTLKDSIFFEIDISKIKSKKSALEVANTILNDFIEKEWNAKHQLGYHHRMWIESMKGFINMLPEIIEQQEIYDIESNSLRISIIGEARINFRNFFNVYRNSYRVKPYLNFKWRNLSSGENALLKFYARFYALSNDEIKSTKLKKNLIILIDEGDSYLHPAWQKKFVKILLEYLPKVFSTTHHGIKRNIQIVFTTNSPIPASDLPNDNTIFLELSRFYSNKKKGEIFRTIVKDSLNDQKETFAANIYTLFTDSFFINDGLIGAFASDKINHIIKQLTNGVSPNVQEREKIRKLILQIGEPILKRKLMQLYNDRFNLDIHERLDKIEKALNL